MLSAACCGREASLDVVQFLVTKCEQGIQEKDDQGYLPLHHAVTNRAPVEVVVFLVNKWDRAIQERTDNGWLPLHLAVCHQSLEVVQFLSSQWEHALLEKTNSGCLLLHCAAAAGSVEVVEFLLNKREQVLQEADNDGWLPLHHAARSEAPIEVVQVLAYNIPMPFENGRTMESFRCIWLSNQSVMTRRWRLSDSSSTRGRTARDLPKECGAVRFASSEPYQCAPARPVWICPGVTSFRARLRYESKSYPDSPRHRTKRRGSNPNDTEVFVDSRARVPVPVGRRV